MRTVGPAEVVQCGSLVDGLPGAWDWCREPMEPRCRWPGCARAVSPEFRQGALRFGTDEIGALLQSNGLA
jgi:hypothetical protein